MRNHPYPELLLSQANIVSDCRVDIESERNGYVDVLDSKRPSEGHRQIPGHVSRLSELEMTTHLPIHHKHGPKQRSPVMSLKRTIGNCLFLYVHHLAQSDGQPQCKPSAIEPAGVELKLTLDRTLVKSLGPNVWINTLSM